MQGNQTEGRIGLSGMGLTVEIDGHGFVDPARVSLTFENADALGEVLNALRRMHDRLQRVEGTEEYEGVLREIANLVRNEDEGTYERIARRLGLTEIDKTKI